MSRDSRANVAQFNCSRNQVAKWSYLYRHLFAFVLHIRHIVFNCDASAKGSRVIHALTWRLFCEDFCRTKKYYMFKTSVNRSRPVRDPCEDFAILCERFATV